MHIIGLVDHPDQVCCRYRLAAYRSIWEADGHHLELRAIPRSLWGKWWAWRSVRGADMVIVQRRLLSGLHLLMLRRNARCLVFDFDDAVYRRDSYAKATDGTQRRRRLTAMIHAADFVVAGNDFLAGETARFIHPSRVHVIPTCIEPRHYPTAEHRASATGARLVWIGSSSTLQGLERKADLVDLLAQQIPGICLKVICDRFPRFAKMRVEATPWNSATEARELAQSDIGVSWVPDDPWSRGKCGLKVLQYMAAGLPVVANPIGVQGEMVRHGETGFLAETSEQWIDAVRRLATDVELRTRMGSAGRRVVEREYSIDIGAARWRAVLGMPPMPSIKQAA